jgi:hypothetical protein
MARRRTIDIAGQRWTVRRCRVPSDRFGDCDYDKRVIRICHRLTGEAFCNTLCHEMIHARWPDLSEDAVREFADELAGNVTFWLRELPDDHEEE